MSKVSRREFVQSSAIAAVATAAAGTLAAQGPTIITRRTVRPVIISSANGNAYRNGGKMTCVEKAFTMMTEGADILDAVVAGVNINELDPLDDSVGFGGLPNSEGIVQLDASCMHGPKKRAGAVAAIEGVRTPSLVALKVLHETDHHLIVGKDAQRFARNFGFEIEDDLNTPNSRKKYLEWRRMIDPSHFLDPDKRADAADLTARQLMSREMMNREHYYGTINCNGVNAKGEVCGVTTTSGLAWKIPGRVGDSPILGAGLFVDGDVGAAGSTGRGEANLFNLSSHLIVEKMRQGMSPKDAGMEALKRIRSNTIEKRLLNSKGNPNFGVTFYIVNTRGDYAGVAMYEAKQFAVCTEAGAKTLVCDSLLTGKPTD